MYLKQYWSMRHKLKIVTIAMALITTHVVQAQDTKRLGLKEAIDLSIQNSKQLKISGAKIEEATASLKEAVQRRLPDAKVAAAYLRLNSAKVDMKAPPNPNGGGGSVPEVTQALYGIVNLSLPVYTGGRIRYGIESLKLLEQAARLDAETQKDEVITNA